MFHCFGIMLQFLSLLPQIFGSGVAFSLTEKRCGWNTIVRRHCIGFERNSFGDFQGSERVIL